MNAPVALPAEVAAFIQGGVSITVASRDDRLVPSIAKGVGCRVAESRDRLTVLVFADAAEAVLRDVARHGQAAVVFSQPTTNRTLQLKGRDVTVTTAGPADVALVRRYLALLAGDLRLLGWDQDYVDALLWHDPSQLLALPFTPEGAFHQTPGPGAGQPLELPKAAPR